MQSQPSQSRERSRLKMARDQFATLGYRNGGKSRRSPRVAVTARRLLALKPTQSAEFTAGERMDRGYAALEPRDVQPGMGEVDLFPAQRAQLGRSQSMPEG